MGTDIVAKKAICTMCPHTCGLLVHVRGQEVVKTTGNPDSPDGRGFICIKGLAAPQLHAHPDRINYPLKRAGNRGEDKWERVTWDQATDEIAARLKATKNRYGPEAVAVIGGTTREPGDWAFWRFCNLFGTPNYINQGRNCGVADFMSEYAVYGYHTSRGVPVPGVTRCALVWGWNPANSGGPAYNALVEAKRRGMKLVVIDPRLSETASKADIWLQIRPGSDGALALGMLHVIINEGLYDREFVEKWCLGFEAIRNYVQSFTPEQVERITWVPAERTIEIARMYATSRPAILSRGVSSCQLAGAGKSIAQAKAILRTITGNLDIEGSNCLGRPFEKLAWLENIHWDKLVDNPDRHRDNVSAEVFPITSVRGYKVYRQALKKVHPLGSGASMYNLVPSPGYVWRAILEEKPYPVKVVFTQGSDPLTVFAQAKKFYEAYLSDKLDLHVAVEQFMTPTAQLADFVLPAADWMERPHLKTNWNLIDHYSLGEKCVEPLHERRDDYQLWRDLGNRLGQQGYWPDTVEQMYDTFLEPSGLSFAEFMSREEHWHMPAAKYRKWEEQGFATFSGKAELTPSIFQKLGLDPLPRYEEPPRSPVRTPELAEQYPLILISGSRVKAFTHSGYRQIEKLRKTHPDPLLEIHPSTATGLGIRDGDWVFIETPEGKVKQKARLTEGIDPRVVHADGYWWYPERPGKAPQLFDLWESNINGIIPDEPEFCDYAGNNYFRALLCKVYKAKT